MNNSIIPFRRCVNPKRYIVSATQAFPGSNYVFADLREGCLENITAVDVAIPVSQKTEGIKGAWIDAEIQFTEMVKVPNMDKQVPVLKRFEVVEDCSSQKLQKILKDTGGYFEI